MLPKRLLYIPGIISLIGLPVLITIHLRQYKDVPKRNIIETYWINRVTYCSGGDQASYIDESRTYIDIELTGDSLSDDQKFQSADSLLSNILNGKDKQHGIHYRFSNTAKYGTFVGVLNKLLKKAPHQYLLYKGGIWISGEQYSFLWPYPQSEPTAWPLEITPTVRRFCIIIGGLFVLLSCLSINRSLRLRQ